MGLNEKEQDDSRPANHMLLKSMNMWNEIMTEKILCVYNN